MSWKNSRDFKAYQRRCSDRGTLRGRELERQVQELLSIMKTEGAIDDFRQTEPNDADDQDGKDFVVQRQGEERAFGVTISQRSHKRSRVIHRTTPQFHFPIGTGRPTMRRRILELFAKQNSNS